VFGLAEIVNNLGQKQIHRSMVVGRITGLWPAWPDFKRSFGPILRGTAIGSFFGPLPGTGATQRLARLVGKNRAIEMMVTGRTFDFDEAKTLGIVNEVWEAENRDAFLAKVLEYAARFTPPNMAAKAIGNIKRAVQTGAELPFQDALAVERELQQLLFQSGDAKEGLAAYVEKRKADFKGR